MARCINQITQSIKSDTTIKFSLRDKNNVEINPRINDILIEIDVANSTLIAKCIKGKGIASDNCYINTGDPTDNAIYVTIPRGYFEIGGVLSYSVAIITQSQHFEENQLHTWNIKENSNILMTE